MLQGALSVECFEKQPEQLKAKTLQSHTHNSRANSLFSVNSVNCKEAMQNVTKSVANIHRFLSTPIFRSILYISIVYIVQNNVCYSNRVDNTET